MPSCLKVGHDLGDMDRRNPLNCLQFNDEHPTHQQIQPSLSNRVAFIIHGDRPLPLKWYAAHVKLDTQGLFIYRFEEPQP